MTERKPTIATLTGVQNGLLQIVLQRDEYQVLCSIASAGQNRIKLIPSEGTDIDIFSYVLSGCFIKRSTFYGMEHIMYDFNGFHLIVRKGKSEEYQIRNAFQTAVNLHVNKEELNLLARKKHNS